MKAAVSVSIRVVAADERLLRRAIAQLQDKANARIVMPSRPGRKGDWLAYGSIDVADLSECFS